MDWKIKFITKNNVCSKVKFITEKLQLQDYEKNHPLDIYFYKYCNKIIKSPLMMLKRFGIQPKNATFSN